MITGKLKAKSLEDYDSRYLELESKGSGSSGETRLVKSRLDGLQYISKYISLLGLT